MNTSKCQLFLIILLFFMASAQTEASHTITKWRHNLSGAISLTFDDGYQNQLTNAVPILNSSGLKATFFLVTSDAWFSEQDLSWDQWRNIAEHGHEIGSHSASHPFLTQLTETEIRKELSQSQAKINQQIETQSCISFCYPYNDYNSRIQKITKEYYIAARKAGGLENSYEELDPSLIRSEHMSLLHKYLECADANTPIREKMTCLVETIKRESNWFVLYWHQIPDDEKNLFKTITSSLIDKGIWIDTFGNISRYMIQTKSSKITVVSENKTEIKINVTHSLPPSTYDVPLTIRSTIPENWTEIQVRQSASASEYIPVWESGEYVIYYDVIPNAGEIVVSAISPPAIPEISILPDSLTASSTEGENVREQSFQIWNSGEGNLVYSVSDSQDWLSCSPDSGVSTGEKDTISVYYATSSLPSGTYLATIFITDTAAAKPAKTIPVTIKIEDDSEKDPDGDGFSEIQGDCNNSDASVHPGANEICGDGIDQDCDGKDLECTTGSDDIDDDGDGFSENQGDCDDSDSTVNPNAAEICGDGIDQDCDSKDLNCSPGSEDIDDDGDGFSENQGDCNDSDPDIAPGTTEICGDGIDQNCNGKDEPCSTKGGNDNEGGCFIIETLSRI